MKIGDGTLIEMEPERWAKRILEIVQKCYEEHVMLQFERFDYEVFKVSYLYKSIKGGRKQVTAFF